MRKSSKYKPIYYVVYILALLALISWVTPPVSKLKDSSIKQTQWHKGVGRVEVDVGPNQKQWVNLQQISKHFLSAVIAHEDARFYDHFGIDLTEMWNSLVTNVKQRQYARGASTITQQLVRGVFLVRDKTLSRKLQEIMGALTLEQMFEKEQILEWYVNIVNFGNSVYGIKEASLYYFDTDPELLTISQSIKLALLLPSPNVRAKAFKKQQLNKTDQRRFVQVLNKMYDHRQVTRKQRAKALATGNFGEPILVN